MASSPPRPMRPPHRSNPKAKVAILGTEEQDVRLRATWDEAKALQEDMLRIAMRGLGKEDQVVDV
jgi:hypothetical protein